MPSNKNSIEILNRIKSADCLSFRLRAFKKLFNHKLAARQSFAVITRFLMDKYSFYIS